MKVKYITENPENLDITDVERIRTRTRVAYVWDNTLYIIVAIYSVRDKVVEWDKHSQTDIAYNYLKERITSGFFKKGDSLPFTSELMQTLGISAPNPIVAARRLLINEGLLRRGANKMVVL